MTTFGDAVADVMAFRLEEGVQLDMTVEEWLAFAKTASWYTRPRARPRRWASTSRGTREPAEDAGGLLPGRRAASRTPIAKSLAVAPYADLLWMETKTADLHDAKEFADAIHAVYPDQMLAYNLSPSFNWDTTGMNDDEMRDFPEELGKMGFVFNFITYGGHQIDGLAAEEFSAALREDGMLALARLQRKFRLLESPYRTPQTLVGGPRADAGARCRCRVRPPRRRRWARARRSSSTSCRPRSRRRCSRGGSPSWAEHHGIPGPLAVTLRPHTPARTLLELSVLGPTGDKVANMVFAHHPGPARPGRSCRSATRTPSTPRCAASGS